MADESSPFGPLPHPSESADPETFFEASLAATPAQRLAWLEEALRLAYATGALKPGWMMTQEKWDAMGLGESCGSRSLKQAPGAFLFVTFRGARRCQ